jgi:tRNA U34 5-methylaminomethyl-2-thiouridine-forming methyltransferase MnmC
MSGDYQLVRLANGENTLFSDRYGEKMHPGLGPSAEAELLYVRQLNLCERLAAAKEEMVVWDVGLGAAANATALLRATREVAGRLHIVSFDNTSEPLAFAMENALELGHVKGYERQIAALLGDQLVQFKNGRTEVVWEFRLGDFPGWIEGRLPVGAGDGAGGRAAGSPHAIFYDAFSPAKNPAMWTLPVFANLFQALAPERPCALTTYSRSTMVRATLLLAGFHVGVGHATGLKEETTIASNCLDLIAEPLDARWLQRAERSGSAEPLRTAAYASSPAAKETLQALRRHPQFAARSF